MRESTVPIPSLTVDVQKAFKTVEWTFMDRFGREPEIWGDQRIIQTDSFYFDGREVLLSCRIQTKAPQVSVGLLVRTPDPVDLTGEVGALTIELDIEEGVWRLEHDLPDGFYERLCSEGQLAPRRSGPLSQECAMYALQRLATFCADLPMIVKDEEVDNEEQDYPFLLVTLRNDGYRNPCISFFD